ncbi:MAG TPA: hypothetical protein PKU74_01735, partial [Candidatus Omnitrophota bacterium]|nr:hypothetical protein [Candidatus Omnitrophota bacterium]
YRFYRALRLRASGVKVGEVIEKEEARLWSVILSLHQRVAKAKGKRTNAEVIQHDEVEMYFRSPKFIAWYETVGKDGKSGRDLIEEQTRKDIVGVYRDYFGSFEISTIEAVASNWEEIIKWLFSKKLASKVYYEGKERIHVIQPDLDKKDKDVEVNKEALKKIVKGDFEKVWKILHENDEDLSVEEAYEFMRTVNVNALPEGKGAKAISVNEYIRKVYPDVQTSKHGILGWFRIVINFNKILATILGTIVLSSYGLIWSGAWEVPALAAVSFQAWLLGVGIIVGLGLLVYFGIKKIDQMVTRKLYEKTKQMAQKEWDIQPLDAGIKPKDVPGTQGRKVRAGIIMALSFLIKFVFNLYIWKWLAIPLSIVFKSSWVLPGLGTFVLPFGNIVLLAVAFSVFFMIFLLDIFAYFYLVESGLGYVLAKWNGNNRVLRWSGVKGSMKAAATATDKVKVVFQRLKGYAPKAFLAIAAFIGVKLLWPTAMFGLISWPVLGLVVGGILAVKILNVILHHFGLEKVGGDSADDIFEDAAEQFKRKNLPASHVAAQKVENGDGEKKWMLSRTALTAAEKAIAWATAWNMIIDALREDDLLNDDQAAKLKYTITDVDPYNALSGRVQGRPDFSAVPETQRVQARIQYFLSSLFMEMDQTPVWEKLYTMSVALPFLFETIIYPFSDKTFDEYDAINERYKTNATFLTYVISLAPHEWKNFVQRMDREVKEEKENGTITSQTYDRKKEDIENMAKLAYGEKLDVKDEDLKFEVRLWISYRYQPLSRSVRGIMRYRQMYEFLAKVNFPTLEGLLLAEQPVRKAKSEAEKSYEESMKFVLEEKRQGLEEELRKAKGKKDSDPQQVRLLEIRLAAVGHEIEVQEKKIASLEKEIQEAGALEQALDEIFEISEQIAALEDEVKTTGDEDVKAQLLNDIQFMKETLAGKRAQLHAKYSYKGEIFKKVDEKFEFVAGDQPYGDLLLQNNPKANLLIQDIHLLLRKFPSMKMAYLHNPDAKINGYAGALIEYRAGEVQNGEDVMQVFKKDGQVTGRVVRLDPIRLHSHPFAGQGKPMNQNNILRFVRGQLVMLMDMNQDLYLEETFKAPNLMENFRKDDQLAIVGLPEDIFTDEFSPAGSVHAFGDHTFVSIVQRTLNFMGIRYHYGHPDFVRSRSFRQLGLFSAPWVNEDIFGAYKATLMGEKVTNTEIMQAGKGREAVYIGLVGISDKFGAGAAEQAIGQMLQQHNNSNLIGFSRSLAHFVASIGYFLRKPFVVISNTTYLLGVVLFGMSLFAGFPSELIFGLIGLFLSQAITTSGIMQTVLEKGLVKGLAKFLKLFPLLAITYMSLVYNAFSVGVKKALVNRADYIATGRRPGRNTIVPFMPTKGMTSAQLFTQGDLYAQVNMDGYGWVIPSILFVISGTILWMNPGTIWSLFPSLMAFASMFAPFLLNPGSTPTTVGFKTWAKVHFKEHYPQFFRKIGFGEWVLTTAVIVGLSLLLGGYPYIPLMIMMVAYPFLKKKGSTQEAFRNHMNLYLTGTMVMSTLTILGLILGLTVNLPRWIGGQLRKMFPGDNNGGSSPRNGGNNNSGRELGIKTRIVGWLTGTGLSLWLISAFLAPVLPAGLLGAFIFAALSIFAGSFFTGLFSKTKESVEQKEEIRGDLSENVVKQMNGEEKIKILSKAAGLIVRKTAPLLRKTIEEIQGTHEEDGKEEKRIAFIEKNVWNSANMVTDEVKQILIDIKGGNEARAKDLLFENLIEQASSSQFIVGIVVKNVEQNKVDLTSPENNALLELLIVLTADGYMLKNEYQRIEEAFSAAGTSASKSALLKAVRDALETLNRESLLKQITDAFGTVYQGSVKDHLFEGIKMVLKYMDGGATKDDFLVLIRKLFEKIDKESPEYVLLNSIEKIFTEANKGMPADKLFVLIEEMFANEKDSAAPQEILTHVKTLFENMARNKAGQKILEDIKKELNAKGKNGKSSPVTGPSSSSPVRGAVSSPVSSHRMTVVETGVSVGGRLGVPARNTVATGKSEVSFFFPAVDENIEHQEVIYITMASLMRRLAMLFNFLLDFLVRFLRRLFNALSNAYERTIRPATHLTQGSTLNLIDEALVQKAEKKTPVGASTLMSATPLTAEEYAAYKAGQAAA